jgi:hypothetical protein
MSKEEKGIVKPTPSVVHKIVIIEEDREGYQVKLAAIDEVHSIIKDAPCGTLIAFGTTSCLYISRLYDFDEVIEWLKSFNYYGKDGG